MSPSAELVFLSTEGIENTSRSLKVNLFCALTLGTFSQRELSQQFLRGGFSTAEVRQYLTAHSQTVTYRHPDSGAIAPGHGVVAVADDLPVS